MARLVDADALIKAIENIATEISFNPPINRVIVKDVEFAEVVRCKDCEWRNWETNGCNINPCVEPWFENDFCSWAKRKGGE